MGGAFHSSLHTDGAYADSDADDDEPVIRVTHGYSRDHRPDLKQVVTRFICENQAGIPLFQTFACEADATAALQAFCQTLKLTEVHEPQIIASPRRKRGRPGTRRAVLPHRTVSTQTAA